MPTCKTCDHSSPTKNEGCHCTKFDIDCAYRRYSACALHQIYRQRTLRNGEYDVEKNGGYTGNNLKK